LGVLGPASQSHLRDLRLYDLLPETLEGHIATDSRALRLTDLEKAVTARLNVEWLIVVSLSIK
jgi:hypothetical protein